MTNFFLVSILAITTSAAAFGSNDCPDLRGVYGECLRQDFGKDKWYKVGYALAVSIDRQRVPESSGESTPVKYTVAELALRTGTHYVLASGTPGTRQQVREQHERYFSCADGAFVVRDHEVVPFFPGDAPSPDHQRKVTYGLSQGGDALLVYVVDNFDPAPYRLACKRL